MDIEHEEDGKTTRDRPPKFTTGNLTMSTAVLKAVPVAAILEALATHDRERARQECATAHFVTKHQSPLGSDFKVVTDCGIDHTSICLEKEDPEI